MLALLSLLPALLLTVSASPVAKRYAVGQKLTHAKIVSGRDGQCLAAAPKTGVGSAVYSTSCTDSVAAIYWDLQDGSGTIFLSGTENLNPPLALDAGSNPGNNGALKVWQSYPGLYQQTWYLTADNRIAITGGNQCLDEGDNGVQTYQCTTGNTNQVWYVQPSGSPPPSSSSSSGPTSTSSSSSASSTPTGVNKGYYIHPGGNSNLCVTVQNGYDGVGTDVQVSDCFGASSEFDQYQRWTIPTQGGAAGALTNQGNNHLCLDAGNNPANGSGLKVWTCYSGLLQQTWKWDGNNFVLGNGQAMDVVAGSGPGETKPYGQEESLQTWQQSTNNDPQQRFTVTKA